MKRFNKPKTHFFTRLILPRINLVIAVSFVILVLPVSVYLAQQSTNIEQSAASCNPANYSQCGTGGCTPNHSHWYNVVKTCDKKGHANYKCSDTGTSSKCGGGSSGGGGGGGSGATCSNLTYNQCAKTTGGCVQNYNQGDLVQVHRTTTQKTGNCYYSYTCNLAKAHDPSCGSPTAKTHLTCQNHTCHSAPGAGSNQCTNDCECTSPPSCSNNGGGGVNAGPINPICFNGTCTQGSGKSTNTCASCAGSNGTCSSGKPSFDGSCGTGSNNMCCLPKSGNLGSAVCDTNSGCMLGLCTPVDNKTCFSGTNTNALNACTKSGCNGTVSCKSKGGTCSPVATSQPKINGMYQCYGGGLAIGQFNCKSNSCCVPQGNGTGSTPSYNACVTSDFGICTSGNCPPAGKPDYTTSLGTNRGCPKSGTCCVWGIRNGPQNGDHCRSAFSGAVPGSVADCVAKADVAKKCYQNYNQQDCPVNQVCCQMVKISISTSVSLSNNSATPQVTQVQATAILVPLATGEAFVASRVSGSNVLGSQTYSATDVLTYDTASGNYVNANFNLGSIPPGQYQIYLHIDKYLTKQLTQSDGSTTFTLDPNQPISTSIATMIPGDIAPAPHGDNFIDILDYNKVASCMNKQPVGNCQTADLNNDGSIGQDDIDIVLSHFGATGDTIGGSGLQFTCIPDPNCQSGNSAIQLCPLKCGVQSSIISPQ